MIRSIVHCVPRNDLIEHDTDAAGLCVCGPELTVQHGDDALDRYVYTHHSLDGRERYERI